MKCDISLASSVPMGAPVVAVAGTGAPPLPSGGAVTAGDYQLVSETVWGEPPVDTSGWPRAGSTTTEVLHASCDTYNVVIQGPNPPADSGMPPLPGFSNGCGRLVPESVSLAMRAGLASTGDPWATPYSATPTTLTLINLGPYTDYASGLVEASLTYVQEFVLVGSPVPPSMARTTEGPPAGGSALRDPRCPATPPAVEQCCSPGSAPLGCEYGGDAHARCTTVLVCALQSDGEFRFVSPITAGRAPWLPCKTNPPGCPSTYATAVAREVSSQSPSCANRARLLCDYPEAVCGCGDSASLSAWACQARPPAGSPCPTERPLAGDACANEGQQCDYGAPCAAGTWAGSPMICQNGYWELLGLFSTCSLTGP